MYFFRRRFFSSSTFIQPMGFNLTQVSVFFDLYVVFGRKEFTLFSKSWRAAPLYRQESFYLWERLSASIIAAGKPLPLKMTQLAWKREIRGVPAWLVRVIAAEHTLFFSMLP
jgi:hypothetical protein